MIAATEQTDTRSQILRGCGQAMAEFGFKRMTVDDIAAQAGLAKRTLYLHFSGKEEIVRETIEEVVDFARNAMTKALEEEPTAEAMLRRMLTERITLRAEGFSAYHESLKDVNYALYAGARKQTNFFATEEEIVSRAVEVGVRNGEFAAGDPKELAEILVRATNAYMPSTVPATQFMESNSMRRRLKMLVDMLIKGLKA